MTAAMTDPLLAISMYQPWAVLHCMGIKQNETRPNVFRLVGKRIYIQAALKVPAFGPPWEEISCDANSIANHHLGAGWRETVARGAIIGRVDYVCMWAAAHAHGKTDRDERALGNYDDGRYAYAAQNFVLFNGPIPCRGFQGVPFKVSDEVGAAIYRAESTQP